MSVTEDNQENLITKLKPCDMKEPFVFVSYSKQDKEKVYSVVYELQKEGYNIWIDKELRSEVGKDWQLPALKAIAMPQCKAILYFMSENSITSAPVFSELYWSKSEKVRNNNNHENMTIIPINASNSWNSTISITDWLNASQTKHEHEDLRNETYEILEMCGLDPKYCQANSLDALSNVGEIVNLFLQKIFIPLGGNKLTIASMDDLSTIKLNIPNVVKNHFDQPKHEPTTPKPTKPTIPQPAPKEVAQLHGAYSLYDLTTLKEYKGFTAKWFNNVGMRVINHPQFTINPCKNVSVLTKQFVSLCIKEQGEAYIRMVNKINQGTKNPVFVKTDTTQNYKVMYSKIDILPAWSMNINFSPYNFLKELRARLEELNIKPQDVELIFDSPDSFTSDPIITSTKNEPIVSTGSIDIFDSKDNAYRDALYSFMDQYANHQGALNGTHPLYQLICVEIPGLINAAPFMQKQFYSCVGSSGKGNWASCPWIAIFNTNITNTTTEGVYIVYLLNPNTKTLYLTLDQGMTAITKQAEALAARDKGYFKANGYKGKNDYVTSTLKKQAIAIRKQIGLGGFSDEAIDSGKDVYDEGCICSKKYTIDSLPSNEVLMNDLKNMLDLYDKYYDLNK